MKHVYGPVPSRRLGRSLGVDPIPLKTCNWNCVYCQLGRTKPYAPVRKEFYPAKEVLDEVGEALKHLALERLDYITLVGSGETLLYSAIGELIRGIKDLTPIPVAVITNGSLLHQPEVRAELMTADAVLPNFDAATSDGFTRINRPHPSCSYHDQLEGLCSFREEYEGKLWPEVMLVKDLNDTEDALKALANVFEIIRPDKVHLSLPIRPPAEIWVRPSDEEGLMRAIAILGKVANVMHPYEGNFGLPSYETPESAILNTIARHPMTLIELEHTLTRWVPGSVCSSLRTLAHSGKAKIVERYGTPFWCAATADFPEKTSRPLKEAV